MSSVSTSKQQLDAFQRDFDALRLEIGKIVVGQADVIDGVLTAAIAGGHVLLEGVPGLGRRFWSAHSPKWSICRFIAFSSRPT